MKKLLILYGRSNWDNAKPFENEKYKQCYEYFYEMAQKQGLEIYRASYQWYDAEKKIFTHAWTFKDGAWQRAGDVKPDLIHDKTKSRLELHYFKDKLQKDYQLVNDPEFTILADNKFFTSLLFPEYFKKYFRVQNTADLEKASSQIAGDKVVIKPANGSGGEDVQIIDKKDLEKIDVTETVIAQEFVDSSNGIDGIVEGVHDLRLVFIDNEFIYSYTRQPKPGSLLANIAQGGTMTIIEEEKLPKKVFEIAAHIQNTFEFYNPKIYTIDFIFDENQTPWVVEMNTMPGMYFAPDQKKEMDKFYGKLIETFKQTLL